MAIEDRRIYRATDSELAMFVSNLIESIRRDAAEFAAKGITEAMIVEFEDLGNEFEVFPKDSYYLTNIMICTDAKNERREEAEMLLREIVGLAAIKWGERSAQVKRFDAGKMTKARDRDFMSMGRLAVITAEEFLTELAGIGLTQAKIDALAGKLADMETEMANIAKAAMRRDLKTTERVERGNTLYRLAAKYCEVGKIIWQDVNEAKYKRYVAYKMIKK